MLEDCCKNCVFVMKKNNKLICITSNAVTQEHYNCDKFINKETFLKDKPERI